MTEELKEGQAFDYEIASPRRERMVSHVPNPRSGCQPLTFPIADFRLPIDPLNSDPTSNWRMAII